MGIEDDVLRVEVMALFRIERSVEPEAIFNFFVIQIVNRHGPDLPEAAFGRKRNFRHRLGGSLLKEDQRASGGVDAEDGKIDTVRDMACAKRHRVPVAKLELSVRMGRALAFGHLAV